MLGVAFLPFRSVPIIDTVHLIGHFNGYPTMHYFGNPGHSVNDSVHNFDWVFLEIPARYCILGYSLTCSIKAKQQREIISAEESRLEDTIKTGSISESDNQNAHKLVSMNEKPGKKCWRHANWLNALIYAFPACRYSVCLLNTPMPLLIILSIWNKMALELRLWISWTTNASCEGVF